MRPVLPLKLTMVAMYCQKITTKIEIHPDSRLDCGRSKFLVLEVLDVCWVTLDLNIIVM